LLNQNFENMKTEILNYRKFISLTLVAILLLSLSQVISAQQKREVSGFDKISYAISGKLEITQGSKEELLLVGDADDLAKITTRVEGNELKIYTKDNNTRLGEVKVMVTVKNLNGLSVAGSGEVEFKSDLNTGDFSLELSGSSNITCPTILAKGVKINLAGSGDIKMGGKLEKGLKISIAGSGDIDCSNLEAKEVQVDIAGSGNTRVWATDKLETNIVGSGSVYYKGHPLVDSETTGSGSTKPL
jgi:hypothetical protein